MFGDAATSLGNSAGALKTGVQELERSAGATAGRLGEFQQAVKTAAEPLERSSREFALAGEAAKAAAAPLATAVQGFGEATSKVADLGRLLVSATEEGNRFAVALGDAAKRFDGVDRTLADTIRSLQGGLEAYTAKVSEFTTMTNDNMAKAVDGLGGLVRELSDTVEELVDLREPAGAMRS